MPGGCPLEFSLVVLRAGGGRKAVKLQIFSLILWKPMIVWCLQMFDEFPFSIYSDSSSSQENGLICCFIKHFPLIVCSMVGFLRFLAFFDLILISVEVRLGSVIFLGKVVL